MSPPPGSSQSELFSSSDSKCTPSISSDSLHSSIFPQDGQLIEGKEHFWFISLPRPHYHPQCLALGICLQNLSLTSTFILSHGGIVPQASRMSVCWANVWPSWKNFGETLENPEDQCEFSLNDSCCYHILLWTCSISADMELACLGGLRAGTRTGSILGNIFPSCSTSQMSGPLVPIQIDQCFWFGPTKAPAAAVAMYGL